MSYEINVVRGKSKGRLTFSFGDVTVDTGCWWDPNVVAVAGTYTGYATHMANKKNSRGTKREAIWFGKHVPIAHRTRKSNDIFIHMGTSSAWSDGCIVAAENEVLKIWNAISPKEQANVSINVSDSES
jgi:hypothetical protein